MKKGFIPIILIAALAFVIAVGGVGIGLTWRTDYLDKILPPNIKEMFGRGEKPEEKPGGKPEELSACGGTASSLESLDETWNKYTDCALGFSIKVPKKMSAFYGSCEWKTDSYRPKEALVPVKIFEDNDNGVVYITSEYYHELAGETVKGGVHYYSKCDKVLNSLERIKSELRSGERGHYQQAWDIVVKDVANDSELDAFIKERYGWGCSLGEKTPAKQEGVYSLGIASPEGVGGIEEAFEKGCLVNYMTVLKYFPAKNKVVSWHIGQAYTFSKTLGTELEDVIYDEAMVESFEFLE